MKENGTWLLPIASCGIEENSEALMLFVCGGHFNYHSTFVSGISDLRS